MLGGVQGLVENDMFAAHLHAPLVAGLWVLDECARQNVLLQPCHGPIECTRRAGGRLVRSRAENGSI